MLLALLLHAGVGFVLFWDDRPANDVDPTASMGAGPALSGIDAQPVQPAQPVSEPAVPRADRDDSAARSVPIEREPALPRSRPRSAPAETAAAAVQPSFDCRLAQSVAEDLICADPTLARLDRDLARLYDRAKFVTRDPIAFRAQTQDEWLRREETCTDRKCLIDWYAHRRRQLNEVIAQARPR